MATYFLLFSFAFSLRFIKFFLFFHSLKSLYPFFFLSSLTHNFFYSLLLFQKKFMSIVTSSSSFSLFSSFYDTYRSQITHTQDDSPYMFSIVFRHFSSFMLFFPYFNLMSHLHYMDGVSFLSSRFLNSKLIYAYLYIAYI